MSLTRHLLTACLLLPCAAAFGQDDSPDYGRNLAPAVRAPRLVGAPEGRLEFNFGRDVGRAWLAPKGELRIDSWVQHDGLLCAVYEVGIRFGEGENRTCANARWLAPTHWLTRHRQCNNALVNHAGSDIDPHMADVFESVTCAQRLVRCTGNCP